MEPQWSSTALTHVYSSGGLFKQDYNSLGFVIPPLSSALGVVINNSTFITNNWSQTIQNESGVDATNIGTTVKGTTNSVLETATFNFDDQTGSTVRQETVLNTQASQTSTTTTVQRTRTTTQTSSRNYSAYSTTSLSTENTTYRTTTLVTSQTQSFKRSVSQTHTENVDTTTTTGSHLGGAYAATVYQANTRHASNANVIWVAEQSVVSDELPQGAASESATSTTRTTIWPVVVVASLSVYDKTQTSNSNYTNTSLSQLIEFTTTSASEAETTVVLYKYAIPQITATENGFSTVSVFSSVSSTVFNSNTFPAFVTKSFTQTGQSIEKISDTKFGFEIDRTYNKRTSRTISTADTFWTTSGTSTNTAPKPTAIWKTSSGLSDTVPIEGNDRSASTRVERGVTTLVIPYYQATTTMNAAATIEIEAVSGARTPQDDISGFYGAEGISCFAEDAFVLASRNVYTANPKTFEISTNNGNLEEPEFSKSGTATLSHLQGTATTTQLQDETETITGSFTFLLQPESQGTTIRGSSTRSLVSCGGALGKSETAYVTIPAGVYKDLSGQTYSKSEEVSSYTFGEGLEYLEAVTWFQTGQTQGVSALLWTVPRNSTALP